MKTLILIVLLLIPINLSATEIAIGTSAEIIDTYHWHNKSGVTFHIAQDFGKYVVRYSRTTRDLHSRNTKDVLSVQRRFKYFDLGLGLADDGLKICAGVHSPLKRIIIGWLHCSNGGSKIPNFTHDSLYIGYRW